MGENPSQSPDAAAESASSETRLDRFRRRMKAFFRIVAVVCGLLTVLGAMNGGRHVWRDYERGAVEPLSLSMRFGALVTAAFAVMIYWVSKRL